MTTYKIETNASGEIFVKAFDKTDELGIGRFAGGPYKNEESAKRRIRDLKRKDAEAPDTASSLMPDQGEETILTPMVTIGTPQHAKLMTERNIMHAVRWALTEQEQTRLLNEISKSGTPLLTGVKLYREMTNATLGAAHRFITTFMNKRSEFNR